MLLRIFDRLMQGVCMLRDLRVAVVRFFLLVAAAVHFFLGVISSVSLLHQK